MTGSLGQNEPNLQGSLQLTLLPIVGGWSLQPSLLEHGPLHSPLHRVTICGAFAPHATKQHSHTQTSLAILTRRRLYRRPPAQMPTWNHHDVHSSNMRAYCTGRRLRRSLPMGITRTNNLRARTRQLESSTNRRTPIISLFTFQAPDKFRRQHLWFRLRLLPYVFNTAKTQSF
jgi:hypothetical protein